MNISPIYDEIQQGTEEWLALRKTKITATDAPIIMGANPWKSREDLLKAKLSNDPLPIPSERMQRGIELEPIARDLFIIKTGIQVQPKVVIKGWTMASMDGLQDNGKIGVEIKCPGVKDHDLAMIGQIPAHYIPQLQHQIYVCDLEAIYYFSFDGIDGIILECQRDDDYIINMIDQEWKFYQEMQSIRGEKL